MKRSEINAAIKLALDTMKANNFYLPPFGYWTPEDWKKVGPEQKRVAINGLGWDITDFGSGDFDQIGAVLVTMRNGNASNPAEGTPYAEKAIIMKPGQFIPLHFHWGKTEDIINRGGGKLVVTLYNSLEDESVDFDAPVNFFCDGCGRTVEAGGSIVLEAGESITLTPGMYHKLGASEDDGVLICGEVSTVNDDRIDNRFAEQISRFADIDEDEPPIRLLCNEYPAI